MKNDEIVLRASIFRTIFLLVEGIFSIIFLPIITWVFLMDFTMDSWKIGLVSAFYYFLLFYMCYYSIVSILTRPIEISLIDECFYLKFVFKTLVFEVDSIKGYSTSTAKGGKRNVDLICLYIQDYKIFDFMNYDFKKDKLRNILDNSGCKYLGGEPYKFKYLGFIKRIYKY